jgi:hypothetical protein
MDQRERIKRIVLAEFPGSTIVFHEETGESNSALRAARVADLFGAKYSPGETISFTIEDGSGSVIPKLVIVGPDDLSDEGLRRILCLMN